MRIAVDDAVLKNQFQHRGKGVYLRNLLDALGKYTRRLPAGEAGVYFAFPPHNDRRYDLFFQPDSDSGLSTLSCPQVVMFHDVTPWAMNRYSERGWLANQVKKWLYHRNLHKVVKADFFLTNSEYTKRDLIKYLKVKPKKIGVTHLGVSQIFFEAFRASKRLKKQREIKEWVGGEFLLHVGGVEYNKNLPALVRAYAELPEDLQSKYKLVAAGSQLQDLNKPETRLICKLLEELGLTDRVFFPGFVEDENLPYWYQAATLFVYPSLREGFGLPPLEAMASGTPAAVSRTASLPEVCGPAVCYFDPKNVNSIRGAMVGCLENEDLRKKLVEAGLARASWFTWQKCAQKTWGYFEMLVKS